MRPRPDIEEDQRPEVNDRKPVTEHRASGRFGQEIIHQAQIRRGQEERHGVVAVPPLHQRILHAGVGRVALPQAGGHFQRIDDVQHRDRDRAGNVKPDRHIHVLFPAFGEGAEQIDRKTDPHNRDGDVNRPFQFRVFLAAGEAQRQRDGGADDDRLPAPEIEPAQQIAEHPRFAQPLQRIVNAHEHAVADKGKNDGVGVQRPQPAKGRERQVQAQRPGRTTGRRAQARR